MCFVHCGDGSRLYQALEADMETKIWALDWLIALGMSPHVGMLGDRVKSKKLYECIVPQIYTHICKYFYA